MGLHNTKMFIVIAHHQQFCLGQWVLGYARSYFHMWRTEVCCSNWGLYSNFLHLATQKPWHRQNYSYQMRRVRITSGELTCTDGNDWRYKACCTVVCLGLVVGFFSQAKLRLCDVFSPGQFWINCAHDRFCRPQMPSVKSLRNCK